MDFCVEPLHAKMVRAVVKIVMQKVLILKVSQVQILLILCYLALSVSIFLFLKQK